MKHVFLLIAIGISALFLSTNISGCTTKSGQSTSKNIIKVACWGTPEELSIITSTLQNWQKDHPDIEVKVEHTNYSDYVSKILTRIAGGTPPDIIFTEVDIFANFYSKDAFMDLTPFIQADNDFKIGNFFQEVVNRFTKNEKIYCIPRDTAPFACVYYNKDIFDEAKVPYPSDDWNWNDLLDKAKQLTKKSDGITTQYGFYTWAWQNFVFSNGGNLVDNVDNPTKCTLNDPKAIEGLQYHADLVLKHGVSPSTTALKNLGMQVTQMFMSGKLAMLGSGIWETPIFRKINTFDWDVVMFPKGPSGVRGFGTGGSGYCILKTSKHPKEAWEVVKALSGDYGQIRFADEGLAQPANKIIAEGVHWAGSDKPPKNKKMLNEAVKYVTYNPFHPNWRKIVDLYVNPELDLMYSGVETAKQAINKILPKVNRLLEEKE